ncbi:MAG TPA: hypothetical protein VL359_06965 [bacterium]|nr:hypothetical protein [bacterium]
MALALWAGMLAHGGSLQAQAQFPGANTSNLPGALFANQPQVFPQDGRIKLLVLALNPTGVTESAAEQMGLILEKNLSNTGHFAVVGPRETNAAFEKDHPNLVDCREIACGVQSGKILGADRILVGTLRSQENRFYLRVRVIDPANNLTDYEEEIRFTDTSMDDDLFSLANSVSRNSLSIGRVLSTSIRGLVISLGKRQGLKIGDMMVIYKQDVPINDLEGQPIDVQRKNIAIVKVLNVNENTTEAILVHQTEEPQVGQYAATYLDPGRQIELVENTRRELDVGIRLANKVRPLELAPVALADSERKKWQYKLAVAEHDRDFWRTAAGLGAVVTLYNLNFYDSSTIGQLRLYGAAGVTVFSVIKWLHAREEINQINVEGRAKGYVWDFAPTLTPQGPAIAMSLKW